MIASGNRGLTLLLYDAFLMGCFVQRHAALAAELERYSENRPPRKPGKGIRAPVDADAEATKVGTPSTEERVKVSVCRFVAAAATVLGFVRVGRVHLASKVAEVLLQPTVGGPPCQVAFSADD